MWPLMCCACNMCLPRFFAPRVCPFIAVSSQLDHLLIACSWGSTHIRPGANESTITNMCLKQLRQLIFMCEYVLYTYEGMADVWGQINGPESNIRVHVVELDCLFITHYRWATIPRIPPARAPPSPIPPIPVELIICWCWCETRLIMRFLLPKPALVITRIQYALFMTKAVFSS